MVSLCTGTLHSFLVPLSSLYFIDVIIHIVIIITIISVQYVGLALAREVLMFSMLSILLMQLLGTFAQARRT